MLKTPLFWLMFVMMTMMSTSGLMVTSQMASFAADFGVSKVLVFGLAALPLALTIDRFTNGLTRPLFGWISDRLGRENTMCFRVRAGRRRDGALAADARQRGAVRAAVGRGVLRLGRDFFAVPVDPDRHVRYALSPPRTMAGSTSRSASARSSAARSPRCCISIPGSWVPVFGCAITLDLVTAVLAMFVLKPARARFVGANG